MKISQLLTIDTIALDVKADTKEEAIYQREKLFSTRIAEIIAIPHAQIEYVK